MMDPGSSRGGDLSLAAGREPQLGCPLGHWLIPLMLAGLAACSGDPLPTPAVATAPLPAPSAQPPPTPSPEPTPVSVWIAPSVPGGPRGPTPQTPGGGPPRLPRAAGPRPG